MAEPYRCGDEVLAEMFVSNLPDDNRRVLLAGRVVATGQLLRVLMEDGATESFTVDAPNLWRAGD